MVFGTRHLASEANAYLISGRYLLRKCALPIVLAALAVVAIHFVETSWTGLLSDLGLAHTRFGDALARPVDRATYAVLLQSVAAVTGVFLALYFTAVSTVAATVYTEVPHDIRNLMLRDKLGNFYVRVVAFLSALALFLLVEEASGGAAYHLALPLVALLAGFAVFAFITLGQRAFYFSDPTVLSQLVVGDFQRWFSDATAGGWRWTDPSFQEHYRKQARRTLGSLVALLEFSQTHDFVRDDSERSVLSWILVVLRAYVGKKTTVPTGSRWFGEAYEHPQWYLSESIALSMATQTASPLSPTTIPDVNWVEKALLEPVITTVCNDLRQNRGEDAYVTLAALHPLFQRFGTQLDAQAAIGWVMKLSDRALEAIATAPQHVPEPERNLVSRVASIDMLAGLTVGLEVGLYRRLSDLDVATLTTTLTSTRWERDDAPYKVRMPRPVVETLEELQAGIKFESEAQADVRTPNWYVAEIARNRLAWCAQAEFDACLTHVETWYSQTADRLFAMKQPQAAGAVLARGVELAWKLARHLDSLSMEAHRLGEVGALDDLNRPDWDWPAIGERVKAFRRDILIRMAGSIPALAAEPRVSELPDFLGQAVHWSGDAAFRALVDNDADLFRELFPAYFGGVLHTVKRLGPQVSEWTDPNTAVTWMSEPIVDLIDLSGYALIYSEYHNNPVPWSICRDLWDQYLSGDSATTRMRFLAAMCGHHQHLFAISPRSVLRTEREMTTTQLLAQLPHEPGRPGFYDSRVMHDSALIRRIAPSGLHAMAYFDAQDVFVVRYLMTRPDAAGLDFGISDDKVEDLSQLDDPENDDDEGEPEDR